MDIEHIELGTGYTMLCKNRPENCRGYSTGGVAIAFEKSIINLKLVQLPDNDYEIVYAAGNLEGCHRKFVTICVYMPPGRTTSASAASLAYLVDSILEL